MRILAFILPLFVLMATGCGSDSKSDEKEEETVIKPEKYEDKLSYSLGILASSSVVKKLAQSNLTSLIIPDKMVKGINDFYAGGEIEIDPMKARENLSQFFRQLQETGKPPVLNDRDKEILSYSIGVDAIREMAGQFKDTKVDSIINMKFVVDAMNHYIMQKEIFINEEEANKMVEEFFEGIRKKNMEKVLAQYQDNKLAGEKYLEENKKKKGVKVTQSGLQIETLRQGNGVQPKLGDTVEVHYTGTTIDGVKFDSSHDRKETYTFIVDYNYPIILGWIEAVQQMKKGGKYRIVLPHELAYKDQLNQVIKPYSTLVFEIELISVNEVAPPK